ncbi:MAG: Cof-type HAD-IIB family hydrolase [Gemmatimonadetes bacterium]|nr:Cof-type HAD-IIB family hydrolase [Gemmatimonadota bacterium]
MTIDLVFIDVDGTLVGSSGTVPPAVWAAAERTREAGVRLALCSGRPGFGRTRGYAERLDREGWHVFQNGASVLNVGSGASLSHALPAKVVAALVERARRTGRALELYTDADYAVESGSRRVREHAALLGVEYRPRDLLSLEGRIVRAQWVLAPDEADAVLEEPHDGLTRSRSVAPAMPDTVFINLTPPGVGKAEGVRAVAAAYGVPLERVMMVGDADNDVGALRAVGWPVAMGNADPEVRAVARHAVGHVDEGGLVEALALAQRHAPGRARPLQWPASPS